MEKSLKQTETPTEFFEKYGFTLSMTKPHPKHKDTMFFDGLEADYVSALERQVTDLEKYIRIQADKIDFLMNEEYWKHKDLEK